MAITESDFLDIGFTATNNWTYQTKNFQSSNGKVYEVSAWVKKFELVQATIIEKVDGRV